MARRWVHRQISTGMFARKGNQYPTPSIVYTAPDLSKAKVYSSKNGGAYRKDNEDDFEWVEVELTIKGEG